MTRVRNWYKDKSEAISAWEERKERLGHLMAEVRKTSNNEHHGYYVGTEDGISKIDKRYVAKIIKKPKNVITKINKIAKKPNAAKRSPKWK